jgi:hypothetical protein
MIQLGEHIIDFIAKEAMLIGTDVAVHNNSSDILESLFGRYKARKSPNKLNGVTPYILFMPIYTRLTKDSHAKKFDFKATLEDKRIWEIDAWAKKNLSPNLVQLRTRRLQKAG